MAQAQRKKEIEPMKTRKDTRTIEQVAKSVAAMRRRVGAAVRRHEKLQKRIARLEAEGRIVSLNRDSEILAGIQGWYVKSDSLNPDPDSVSNWYYEVTYSEQCGYGCGCERLNGDCKHITKLAATFAPVAQPVAAPARREEEQRYIAPLNRRDGAFSILR